MMSRLLVKTLYCFPSRSRAHLSLLSLEARTHKQTHMHTHADAKINEHTQSNTHVFEMYIRMYTYTHIHTHAASGGQQTTVGAAGV